MALISFWCAVFDDADCRNCRSCTVCLPFGHCTFLRAGGREGKNLHVEGFATETDTSKYEQQVTALQGIATPSDLTDTWVEQPFEQATPSDVSAQDTEGADTLPADDAEAKPVVID